MNTRWRGFIVALILAFVPVAILAFRLPLVDLFTSPEGALNTVGKFLGLAGLSLFSLNFVFTARWKFLAPLLGPLDQQYVSHHLTGGLAFIFLLIHPTLMTLRFAVVSVEAAIGFLFNFSYLPLVLGKTALTGLLVILGLTFYYRFKHYENWRTWHRWLGLFLALGALHAFLIPSDLSQSSALKLVIGVYVGLGLTAYSYRTVFKIWLSTRYVLTVEAVNLVTSQITEVILKPEKHLMFFPGQFAFVEFKTPGLIGQPHPFSITSDPSEDRVRFSIKALGDFTGLIQSLQPGTPARIEGPFGGFSYLKSPTKRQIWIAGGIGITPFLAMARHLARTGDTGYQIDLHYSVKNETEGAFFEELRSIAEGSSNFKFHPYLTDTAGFLTAETILKDVQYSKDVVFFLCGPPSFMASLRKQFKASGVTDEKINYEVFSLS